MNEKTLAKKAHIIVVSNEKGGTGKSTISMHLAISLMQESFSVAVIDMDGRQGTLSKYIANRKKFCLHRKIKLPVPELFTYAPQSDPELIAANRDNIDHRIKELIHEYDAIIIDTPGTKNYLFDIAHRYADTLITPMTDSLIDLNVMADIDFESATIGRPGHYASFIWDVKKQMAAEGRHYLNWIVVGNKTSPYKSKNKNAVFEYLERLGKLYGFRFTPGLKDRLIFKELFLEGLTVLDMQNEKLKMRMTMSHLAAKREVRSIAEFICPDEESKST